MPNEMEQRCKNCHYRVGEGYFTGCRDCNNYNSSQARKRRSKDISDDDFEDERTRLRPGVPRNVQVLHKRASLSAYVKIAPQASSQEKAQSFLQSFDPVTPTAASPTALASTTAAPTAQLPSASAPVAEIKSDREEAEQLLAVSAWRRCLVKENNYWANNLEHDDYDVVFCQRDGDCLFHCFIAILVECGRVNFVMNADSKINVLKPKPTHKRLVAKRIRIEVLVGNFYIAQFLNASTITTISVDHRRAC
jgi:hypothetical protein